MYREIFAMLSRYLLHITVFISILIIKLPITRCENSLGSHSEPSAGVTTLGGKFPPALVFYFHFVKTGRPLLMRDVMQELYPDWSKWTDDAYIRNRYGHEMILMELGKKEDRNRQPVNQQFSTFLDTYDNSDVYMIHSVPDSMMADVLVPPTLQCGGFHRSIQDAILWFSSGDTKSVLHYDALDNFICLFDGQKKFVLFDKKYNDILEADGFVKEGSYSLVDVDSVDEESFPGVARTPWNTVTMNAGDCLFIPRNWFHHVHSSPGRNLAVNFWFSHLWWFNRTDCTEKGRDIPPTPLSNFNIASHYEQMRSEWLSVFEDLDGVSQEEFIQRSACENAEDTWKFWDFISSDGNDTTLSWPELYSFNVADALAQFRQCLVGSYMYADADDDDDDVVNDFIKTTNDDDIETTINEVVDDVGTAAEAKAQVEVHIPNKLEDSIDDREATEKIALDIHIDEITAGDGKESWDRQNKESGSNMGIHSQEAIQNVKKNQNKVENVDPGHAETPRKVNDKVVGSDDEDNLHRRTDDDSTRTHDEF